MSEQIVDHLPRALDRRRLAAARKQLARTLHQLLLRRSSLSAEPQIPPTAPPGSFQARRVQVATPRAKKRTIAASTVAVSPAEEANMMI